MNKYILCMWCLLACVLNVSANNYMTWNDKQYSFHHGDFNGDKIPDVLLQSLSEQSPSSLVFGVKNNDITQYLPENEVLLPDTVDGLVWDAVHASITAFDHNNDGLSDIFIVNHLSKTALVVIGDRNEIDFSIITRTYKEDEFKWLKKSEQYVLYPGDFNGDERHDLLAISEKNKTHYLMHANENNELAIVQEIKKAFRWAKKNDVQVKVADFNSDGRADVFAAAKAKNTKHYLTYTDENGLLGETTLIKEKLQGKDWNSDDFSIVISYANEDNTLDLVRINNMPGGIDENGEFIDAEENEDVDDLSNDCDQLYYSASNLADGYTCAPWQDHSTKQNSAGNKSAPSSTSSTSTLMARAIPIPGDDDFPPETPTGAPKISDSYHPINSRVGLGVTPIYNAYYYEFFTSSNGSTYSQAVIAMQPFATIPVRSSAGYFYIKYRACNNQGCGGLSPYRKLYIYDKPSIPGNFAANPSSIFNNQTITLNWNVPSGLIWTGGYYKITETRPDGSIVNLPTVHYGATKSTSRNVTSGRGTYTYSIYACNETPSYCGAEASTQLIVKNSAPNAEDDSTSVNEDSSVIKNVIANDTDIDGDSLSIASVGNASHGTTSKYNSTSVKYIPNSNYCGSDEFTYSVSDGTANDTATVSVTVSCKNDPPNAVNDSTSVNEDSSIIKNVIANDTDIDGDSLSIASVGNASHGTTSKYNSTSVKYIPNSNYCGSDEFIYSVTDGIANDTATVSVTVSCTPNNPPNAVNDSTSVNEDSSVIKNVIANDTDIDGDSLSIASVGNASHGTASKHNSTSVKYIPNSNYCGSDEFIYSVTDGTANDTATVSVTVSCTPNNPPTISGTPSNSVNVDATYSFTPTASDPDGDSLTFSISGKPSWANFNIANGELSGTPTNEELGNYPNIIISVSDGKIPTAISLPAFSIEVVGSSSGIAIPTGLSVSPSAFELTSYNVSWEPVVGATHYELDERQNNGAWTTIPDLIVQEIEINNGLTTGWQYRVRACVETNCSENSNALQAVQGGSTFQHNDILGSPVLNTNSSGAITQESTYKPFGQKAQ